jgi:diguanylate cyclase (GGDEF)-like protein
MKGLASGGHFTVRTRLILITGTILVLGFLTTNWISFRVSTETLKGTILRNELPLTSSNIYSEIQTDLLRPVFVSSLMSNDTFLKDWLLGGEQDVDSIVRYLDEIRSKYGVFTTFLISERTRNYYHFTGIPQVVDENDPEDVWFFRVRAMTEPYEINVDFNQAQENQVTIFVNYRVLDYDGNFIALTGVGLEVDSVAKIVSRYRDNYRRNVYFVDRGGTITVRSGGDAPISGDNIHAAAGISAIAEAILATEQGYFEYQRNGETMLLTTRHIPELGWHVIVEQRESEALKDLWRSFLTNLAIGAVIVVLTIVIIGYAINVYQKKLEDMATIDKLTGIGNRQVFDLAIDQAIRLRRRTDRPTSVIIFDIDHFKRINDSRGHLAGDRVIRTVAETARRMVRASDVLCRWGGEEFIILAHDCRLADAVEVAEKLRITVAAEPLFTPDDGTRVTVSAGVTEFRDHDGVDDILGRADAALYRVKAEGRNRVLAA